MNKNVIEIFDKLEKEFKKLQKEPPFSKAEDVLSFNFLKIWKTKGVLTSQLTLSGIEYCIAISPDGRAILERRWHTSSMAGHFFFDKTETKQWLEEKIKEASEEAEKLTKGEKRYNELLHKITKGG